MAYLNPDPEEPIENQPGGGGAPANAGNPWDIKGAWTPKNAAELRAYAQAAGWSEDFDRWKGPDGDRMLEEWISKHWDPNQRMFRTEKKDRQGNPIQGFVEKPVDLPEGWTAWGNYAIPKADADAQMAQWGGGGKGASGAGTSSPLVSGLLRMWAQNQGLFNAAPGQPGSRQVASVLPGGALWWGSQRDTGTSSPQTPQAPQPQAPQPQPPAPLPGTPVPLPGSGAPAPGGMSFVSSTLGGEGGTGGMLDLTRFLGNRNRTTNPLVQALTGFPQFVS